MEIGFGSLVWGPLRLELSSRQFFIGKEVVPLRNKEFCLMEYFMRNMGRVLSRTQILEDVWDRNICCCTNTVDVHVSSLRQKLNLFDCSCFIRTVHCVGYVFKT